RRKPPSLRSDRVRASALLMRPRRDKSHHIVKRNRKEMHDEGHISLPALQSDLSQQPQVQIHGGRSAARRAMAAGREGLNIVNRYRILIVDDDAMAREILKRILEHAGYEVMTAGSGPEALRKLHEGIPHLVVVDLMMPEMD